MPTESNRQVAEHIAFNAHGEIVFNDRRLLADRIETALDAERERCAKIAEAHEGHGEWCAAASDDCQKLTVRAIAAAIRGKD